MSTPTIISRIVSGSLVLQIAIGVALGIALALFAPDTARAAMLLGTLFVSALKAVAPVLVLVLVASAIANRKASHTAQMRPIVIMYLAGTVAAALLAVTVSTLFPTTLALQVTELTREAPQGITEVLGTLLRKLVDNPINAMLTANYIGILVWGVLLGVFLHHAAETTRTALHDLSDAITKIVRVVVRLDVEQLPRRVRDIVDRAPPGAAPIDDDFVAIAEADAVDFR